MRTFQDPRPKSKETTTTCNANARAAGLANFAIRQPLEQKRSSSASGRGRGGKRAGKGREGGLASCRQHLGVLSLRLLITQERPDDDDDDEYVHKVLLGSRECRVAGTAVYPVK